MQQLVATVASHSDMIHALGRNQTAIADSADSNAPFLTLTGPARETQ